MEVIKIVLYTLEIALFSTLTAVFIGLPTAFFVAKRRFFGKKILLSSSIIPLCVPPLIIVLGYISFFGMNGFVNRLFHVLGFSSGNQKSFLYSTFGIVIAQGFYNFPLITKIVSDAWSKLPEEQENAARLLGAKEKRIFLTITLPQISGAVCAACIPVFLFCFFSFMIVLLFSPMGKSTIEVEIYHSIRTTLNPYKGTIFAISETLIALVFVFLYGFVSKKSQISNEGIEFSKNHLCRIGNKNYVKNADKITEKIFFTFLLILITIFFICPGIAIFVSAFTQKKGDFNYHNLYWFIKLFTDKAFFKAAFNTFWIGLCTGFLCTTISFIYSVLIKINKKQKNIFLQTIPLFPMAISSVVMAWCFCLVFHNGNPFLLIVMQTLLYWPISYKQLQNGMNKIPLEVDNAALIFSKNRLDSIFRIYLPSCKTNIASAFAYCFAISAGDATLPLVLSIPRFNTIALYTYKLAGTYRFNQACACGIIITVLCGCFVILCDSFCKTQ